MNSTEGLFSCHDGQDDMSVSLSYQNTEIKRLLTSVWAEFEIPKRCEMEMFFSYSEHQSDGGCLISLPSYPNRMQFKEGKVCFFNEIIN